MKRNRLIVGAFDVFSFALVAGVLLAWITPAYAYVDPSVMTYTIQALAGVAVALRPCSVWRFAAPQDALQDAQNRRECRQGGGGAGSQARQGRQAHPRAWRDCAADAESMSSKKASRKGRASDDYPRAKWGVRVVCALIVCASSRFTLPRGSAEIVAGAGADQVRSLTSGPIFAAACVVVAVVLALAVSLLRGRAFDIVLPLPVRARRCRSCSGAPVESSCPPRDGKPVNWGDYTSIML